MELDRWGSRLEDRLTLTEQHGGEKRVRSLAESVLFYVGIPAALLYPLGVLGVGIQMSNPPGGHRPQWRRPYQRSDHRGATTRSRVPVRRHHARWSVVRGLAQRQIGPREGGRPRRYLVAVVRTNVGEGRITDLRLMRLLRSSATEHPPPPGSLFTLLSLSCSGVGLLCPLRLPLNCLRRFSYLSEGLQLRLEGRDLLLCYLPTDPFGSEFLTDLSQFAHKWP